MRNILECKGPAVLIVAAALLWANVAWGLPATILCVGEETGGEEAYPPVASAPEFSASVVPNEIGIGIVDLAAAEGAWRCDGCNVENDASATYCSACGAAGGGGLPDSNECAQCGAVTKANDKFCGDCGYPFGPAADDMVYVPGKGFYAKGTMIEPGHAKTSLWVTGIVVMAVGAGAIAAGGFISAPAVSIPGGVVFIGGVIIFVRGLVVKTDPVYAFVGGETHGFYEGITYARRSPDPDGAALKIEMTLLSF